MKNIEDSSSQKTESEKTMAQGDQVRNGKAFEYAIAKEYKNYIIQQGRNVTLVENEAYKQAKGYYDSFSCEEKSRFDKAAYETIDTMVKIEPGLLAQKDEKDVLSVIMQKDQEGKKGDVRDVVLSRCSVQWEIGLSAKNNNDAVKHSRLSKTLDFGEAWLHTPCSQTYWDEISPLFDELHSIRKGNPDAQWSDLDDRKKDDFYVPLLTAFKKEILYMNDISEHIPSKLVSYLIGECPFYKIIKDDAHNMVIVRAFNINGGLNKTVNEVKSRYSIPQIKLPTRIVEFEFKKGSKDTLNMILDGGWEISFRIHNASKKVEASLKFDVRLIGNPPILFTQHLFQEI